MNKVEKGNLHRNYINCLQHTIIAFRYLTSAIPEDAMFVGDRQVAVGRFVFRKQADALSMRVELGWAFFVRLEAALEAFISQLGIGLSRNNSLIDHLVQHGVAFTKDQAEGLQIYREEILSNVVDWFMIIKRRVPCCLL